MHKAHDREAYVEFYGLTMQVFLILSCFSVL